MSVFPVPVGPVSKIIILFLNLSVYIPTCEIPIKLKPYCGSIEFNFTHYKLFDFIHLFGFPIGKKGNQLFIPKVCYNRNLTRYVIRGFFGTDGSLVLTDNNGTFYPRVEANGIAKDLIKEISDYLNREGIKCNFYEAKRKEHYYPNTQQQYRLQINGKENLKKFTKVIGFVNPKQIEKLDYFYKKMAVRGVKPPASCL